RQGQLRLECGFVELLLLLEVEGVGRQERGGRQAGQGGGGGQQHHVHTRVGGDALLHPPQGGQPLRDQILVRREGVVGQRFPVGKDGATQVGRKKCHLVHQALRVGRVGGDQRGHVAFRLAGLGKLGDQQCI